MTALSISSEKNLRGCDPALQQLFRRVADLWPRSIVIATGHRGQAEQEEAFRTGKSKAHFGESAHNLYLSAAVDAYPCLSDGTIDWNDTQAFVFFAGFVEGIAEIQGVHIRWGGDWDDDGQCTDEKFRDLGHFELKDWEARKPA